MPKRVADHQLTKDGGEAGSDDEGQQGGVTAPVEGRVIRGMPKRKGAAPAPAPAPAAAAPVQTAPAPSVDSSSSSDITPAPAASPFGGFSFGAPKPSFSFGATKPTPESDAPKAFSGFSFGSSSSSSTPAASSSFSFGSSSSAAPAPAPAAATSSFGFGSSPASTTAFGFGAKATASASASVADKPVSSAAGSSTIATEAEPAQKATPFSGFSFGASSAKPPPPPAVSAPKPKETPVTAPAPAPTPIASQHAAAAPALTQTNGDSEPKSKATDAPTDSIDEKETEYLIQLRGLNTSILSFLSNQLESDPLLDLSNALAALGEQYESKLQEVSTKTGFKRAQADKPASVPTPMATKPVPVAKLPAPPVAPPAVGSFKLLAPSSSSSSQSTGGFVPTLPAAPSGGFSFGFGSKPADKKKETETSKLVGDLIADGANGETAAEEQKAKGDKQWQVPALFKGTGVEEKKEEETPAPPAPTPVASTSTPSKGGLFSFGPSNPTATAAASTPPKTFSFSSSAPAPKLGKFGPGGSTPSLSFGASSTPSGTPSTAAKSGFSFGSASTPSGSASASSFSFGAPAAAKEDAPKTSGFNFGSSSSAPAAKAPFSFGQASTESKASPSGAPAAASTSTAGEPSTEASTADAETPEDGTPSVNLAAGVGAGEENEDTVIEQRCKVFKLDGGKQNSLGIVVLRLKREKASGDSKRKRRILARMDPGGSVVLNFGLNASMKPVVNGNTVAFMGFDADGKPANYTLRIKTPAMATALGDALRKEAEEVAAGK